MAGQIRMTPDQMRARAGEYSNEAGKVQDTITKMDNLLKTLQGEWEGAAAESYSARFAELRPSFVKAKELIDEIAKALQVSAQTLEETDQNIAAKLKG